MPIAQIPIAASSDDASQIGTGVVTLGGTTIHTSGGGLWVGLRFLTDADEHAGLQGAVLNSAYITFRLTADNPDEDFYCHDHDNAPTFSTSSHDISSRTRTPNAVNWTDSDLGVGFVNSPELKSIVAPIIARPGWSPGNAIAFILDSLSGTFMSFRTYDYGSDMPVLTLDFTPGGLAVAKVAYYRRLLS